MAKARNDILFRYLADTKGLERGNKRAKKSLGGVSDSAKKLGGALALAFGAREVLQFAGDAIQLAVAAEEVDSKFKSVFGTTGDLSDKLSAWGDMAGVTDTKARDLAATFGNLAMAQGITEVQTRDLTLEVATLAGDMGSFNDADPEQVFFDLNKALLTTEREGLKKYGISVAEAEVKTRAAAIAVADGRGEVTKADRAYAAYAIVVEQAGKANGDLERTQDSLANQQRQVKADLEELQEQIGKDLLPAYQDLIGIVKDLRPVLQAAVDDFGDTAKAIDGVTSSIRDMISVLPGGDDSTLSFSGSLDALKGVAETLLPPIKLLDKGLGFLGISTDEVFGIVEQLNPVMADARVITDQYGSGVTLAAQSLEDAADAQEDFNETLTGFKVPGVWDAFVKSVANIGLNLAAAQRGIGVGGGNVQFLAHGGTIQPGDTGFVGENGPEFISPRGGAKITPMRGQGVGGGTTVNVTFSGVVGDPVAVAEQIQDLLDLNSRVNGPGI